MGRDWCVFIERIRAYVDLGPVTSTVVYILVQVMSLVVLLVLLLLNHSALRSRVWRGYEESIVIIAERSDN